MKRIDISQVGQDKALAAALKVLQAGGLVIYPTETVYGAGVDATNQAAVNKLLAYKTRREGKPLSIAVSSQKMAADYVQINDQAQKLYQTFMPGPVTIVSLGRDKVAKGVQSEFGTLGIRIPDYQLVLDLVKKFGRPITATSANASGQKRPYSVDDLLANLSQKQLDLIDIILDIGTLPPNPPSTVIDTTLSTPVIIRKGNMAKIKHNSQLETKSPEETEAYAGRLMLKHWDNITQTGLVIGLTGPLGAGKTTFTKGVAKFLNLTDNITSPTYTYLHEYEWRREGQRGWLFHADLWKLDQETDVVNLRLADCLGKNHIICVEWFEHGQKYLTEICRRMKVPLILVDIVDQDQTRLLQVNEPE